MLNAAGNGPRKVVELACSYSTNRDAADRGHLHVYARDEHDMVWHTNWQAFDPQLLVSGIDKPEQAAAGFVWQATGRRASYLDVPREFTTVPHVFTGHTPGGVERVSRTPSGEWVSTKVAVGHAFDEAVPTPVHVVQISAVTAQADPVADAPLEVMADKPVLAEHEGQIVLLGPDRPLALKTGITGGARLKIRAESGFEAPVLTVTTPSLSGPRWTCRPQEGAFRRLAGEGFALTPQMMRDAGLLPDRMSSAHAEETVTTLSGMAARALEAEREPGRNEAFRRRGTLTSSPFRLALTRQDDGAAASVVAEFTVLDGMVTDADPSGGPWTTFWNWVSAGWNAVKNIITTVGNEVVSVAIEIGEQVRTFVARTVRQINEAVGALVDWLASVAGKVADGAAKLLELVAEKLGWADVLKARDVVRLHTLRLLDDLHAIVGRAIPDRLSHSIGWSKAAVGRSLDQLADRLDPKSTQVNDRAKAIRGQLQKHGATVLSVQHSIPDRDPGQPIIPVGAPLSARISGMYETVKNATDRARLAAEFEKLQALLNDGATAEQMAAGSLVAVFRLMKPLIMLGFDLADAVQKHLFELLSDIVGLIRDALTTPIQKWAPSLGWINSMYRKISGGRDLDILDLSCLLLVAPGVMLHHLVEGKDLVEKPVEKDQVATLLSNIPQLMAGHGRADVPLYTPIAAKFFKDHAPVFEKVSAVIEIIQSPYSLGVNAIRYMEAAKPGSAGRVGTALKTLFSLAGYLASVYAAMEFVFTYGADVVTEMERLEIKGLPVISFVASIALVLGLIGIQIFLHLAEVTVGGVLVTDLISSTASRILALIDIVAIIVTSFVLSGGGQPRTLLANGARLAAAVRKTTSVGVPFGGMLASAGEPALSSVLVGVAVVADFVLYALGGALLTGRAFGTPAA